MVRVIKVEDTSVLIKDDERDFQAWVDVWRTGGEELEADWNQYIFILSDEEDMRTKSMQEDIEVADKFFNCALNYFEHKNIV